MKNLDWPYFLEKTLAAKVYSSHFFAVVLIYQEPEFPVEANVVRAELVKHPAV